VSAVVECAFVLRGTFLIFGEFAPLNLRIAHSGTNVVIAWPLWASSFTLQEATNVVSGNSSTNLPVTPGVSNNENVVTLPISGKLKLYRPYHP